MKGKAEVWDHRLPPPLPPLTETSLVGRKCLLLISTAENRHSLWWKNTDKAQGKPRGQNQQLCIKPPQYLCLRRSLFFLEPCFNAMQESSSGLLFIALLAIKQCQLSKTIGLKAAWQEGTFTMHPSSPCATSFRACTHISKIFTLLSL